VFVIVNLLVYLTLTT